MSDLLSVRLVGHNRVANKFRRLASQYRDQIDDSVRSWVEKQRRGLKAKGYPKPRRAAQPFKTDRSRRYFFWALKEGLLSVPYRRTGRLASSFSAIKMGSAIYRIENSQPYAAMVIGRGKQTSYHAGHWWVMEDEVEASTPELTRLVAHDLMALAGG